MVHHLLADFLENEEKYQKAQDYWYALIKRASKSVPDQLDWRRTTPATFADGVTLWPKDGNPVIEVTSSRLRRRIQVIMWPPQSEDLELGGWLAQREHWEVDTWVIWDELTLNLSLSEESAAIAEELVRSWMSPETTRDAMEALLRERGAA